MLSLLLLFIYLLKTPDGSTITQCKHETSKQYT